MTSTTEVILCAYNGSEFIEDQLNSIFQQTIDVNKVSIYDDRSTDNTLVKIERFVNALPEKVQERISVRLNDVNLGYAANFCKAVEQATEDILIFCDQDDLWVAEKVAVLLDLLKSRNVDLVFSDGVLIDGYGQEIFGKSVLESYGLKEEEILGFQERAFEFLVKRNYINGAALAIRRTAAQSALPLPCDMPHDYWFGIWCSLHRGIAATPHHLYKYRQHEGNVIGVGSSSCLRAYLNLWRYSDAPREREARIWQAVTERISRLLCERYIEVARAKLNWISLVVPENKSNCQRIRMVIKSIWDGSYNCFSPEHSALRDIFSIIKHLNCRLE